MQFNEYLKQCREHSHFTQEQLARDLYSYDIENFEGLETSTISKWERGAVKPRLSKQISIIEYFQHKTGVDLPYWDDYTTQEAEELICEAEMKNFLGRKKDLILSFPDSFMSLEDLDVYPLRNAERIDALLEINMDLHRNANHDFTQISLDQFKSWSMHPSNLFLACEYKQNFLGLFFAIRLKPESFDKIMNFTMQKREITQKDFASFDEMGCNYALSFYAANNKVATRLFIRYYAHLISNQKKIEEVGVATSYSDVVKITEGMNLHKHKSATMEDGTEVGSYRQNLSKIFASQKVVKMIFAQQECPEG